MPRPAASARTGAALALTALAAAACGPSTPDAVLAEHELLARTVMAAWEARDMEALSRELWPDAVWDDFPNGVTYRGVEEIAAYKSEVHAWASDLVINVTAVHSSPSGATVEWVLYGTQTAPMAGRVEAVTDREVLVNGVTILEVEDGLVARGADYLDTLPLMLQLGGRVELPGGEVLELEGG